MLLGIEPTAASLVEPAARSSVGSDTPMGTKTSTPCVKGRQIVGIY